MGTAGQTASGTAVLLLISVSNYSGEFLATNADPVFRLGLMGWCCPCFLFGKTQSRLKGESPPSSANIDVSCKARRHRAIPI